MKTRLHIATLCDHRCTVDDCVHRITYKFFATNAGLEIVYRHTSKYCSPWATPEERKAQVEKKTMPGSDSLAHALNHLRDQALPVSPCPPFNGNEFPPDMSLKFGDGYAAVTYGWNFGNPPGAWKEIDEFALAAMNEVHGIKCKKRNRK